MAIGASLGLLAYILVFVAYGDTTLSPAVALAVLIGGTVQLWLALYYHGFLNDSDPTRRWVADPYAR